MDNGHRLSVLMLAVVVAWPTGAGAQDDVASVAARAAVQEAFEAVERMNERTLRDHIMLTEIPAPPFAEEVRASAFAELLRDAGADSVWIDEVGNVLALRRGQVGSRTVAVDAHLDTVFPEGTDVTVRVRGDTLFAPGIGDDTRGLAAILAVFRALEEANVETEADLLFVGTVGEEGLGDLRGVKHLFREGGPRIDSWIAVDGGTTGRIVHRGLGSHRYRITFRGPGGHSWGAFGLGNPHHALGRAIELFVDAAEPFTREGVKTSYNVGRIGGGTSINAIPFESWMEVDMRSESPERLVGIDSLLQRAMREALHEANRQRREGEALTVEVDFIGNRPSGELPVSTPLVQRSIAAVEHVGYEAALEISSTDSNVPIAMGIPAVTLGRGGEMSGGHSLGEWWIDRNGTDAIKAILLTAVAEAGISDLTN